MQELYEVLNLVIILETVCVVGPLGRFGPFCDFFYSSTIITTIEGIAKKATIIITFGTYSDLCTGRYLLCFSS